MIKPYTYLLKHKPTGMFYYGVRWANVRLGLLPEQDLWIQYFTSSDDIAELRSQYGDSSFEYEVRRTFDNIKSAKIWEEKVLRRMRVLSKQDLWLNHRTAGAIVYDVHPRLGKGATEQQKQLQREKMTGRPGTKTSWKPGNVPHNAGKPANNEQRLQLQKMARERNQIPWNKGKGRAVLICVCGKPCKEVWHKYCSQACYHAHRNQRAA